MSDNPKFDFETLFKQFDPNQMAKQFQEMFANSPFGDMNTTDLMETQRKTLESIKQANETAVSGAQSLMERQSEMMQQAMADAAKAMQNMAESEPAEAASDNAALVEEAVKKSMENFGEIADMIQGIYTEISDQVERRMEESVNEMKESLAKTKK
jgi:phasin family protein